MQSKGHTKPVPILNIREWVTLAKHFILREKVIAEALAFRRRVEDFFSADYVRLFQSEELQRDVCGMGDDVDNWDESAIRKVFKLDGKYYSHMLKLELIFHFPMHAFSFLKGQRCSGSSRCVGSSRCGGSYRR
jgi:hypothetical protein